MTGEGRPVYLYRILPESEPRPEHFYSNAAAGLLPFGKELDWPELHEAVSLWTTAGYALQHAPGNARFVARLIVPPARAATDIAIHATLGLAGHCDVWASPISLCRLVKRVFSPRHMR